MLFKSNVRVTRLIRRSEWFQQALQKGHHELKNSKVLSLLCPPLPPPPPLSLCACPLSPFRVRVPLIQWIEKLPNKTKLNRFTDTCQLADCHPFVASFSVAGLGFGLEGCTDCVFTLYSKNAIGVTKVSTKKKKKKRGHFAHIGNEIKICSQNKCHHHLFNVCEHSFGMFHSNWVISDYHSLVWLFEFPLAESNKLVEGIIANGHKTSGRNHWILLFVVGKENQTANFMCK